MKTKKTLKIVIAISAILLVGLLGVLISILLSPDAQQPTDTSTPVPENTDNPYSTLYYYEEDKLDRYIAYQANHPDFTTDEVVWRVNSAVDVPGYTEMTTIAADEGDKVGLLINKHHRLPEGYQPAELTDIGNGLQVTPETKKAYDEMTAASTEENIYFTPGSTYRSLDYQEGLYNNYVASDGQEAADTYSARPGSSEHHTGRAIDFVGPDGMLDSFGGTQASTWLAANSWKYGFIIRYTEKNQDVTKYIFEPWHITYVGKEIAQKMQEENIETLEEYTVKYIDHTQ